MKIAVSACLLGEPCRYDGMAKPCAEVAALAAEHTLVPLCPETLGGLGVPRPRCELVAGQGGVRVIDETGADRTEAYVAGARAAADEAWAHGCALAILKSKSPACGASEVYDGTFTGTLVRGQGVAAREISRRGIRVVDEHQAMALLARQRRAAERARGQGA